MKDRAIRRHHRLRVRAKRKDYHGDYNWIWDKTTLESRRSARIKTATPCSCYMCGNPRKWFGDKSLNERKADEAFRCE